MMLIFFQKVRATIIINININVDLLRVRIFSVETCIHVVSR
ncbi:hypothetical protein Lalb_Chr25g0278791 [Lupinus albus]|uniref:Uncharacterized protein n=1 Tax=Lupinus albus TaxID=3870 RepID=A0A6A4N660_LUPAL|nr:hypothetical protein Lalb_Chr25g0278791 [Lupinus albus]